MKNLVLILASILGLSSINAQNRLEQLICDPDIIWLKTYEVDLLPHLGPSPALDTQTASGTLIKFQARPINGSTICRDRDYSLATQLWEALKKGKLRVYRDQNLVQVMAHEELMACIASKDTLVYFDPNTFEEKRQPYIHYMYPKDIVSYRQYGVFYYHKTEHLFKTVVISMALMQNVYNDDGALTEQRPLCWIPVQTTHQTNLNDPSIGWAARTVAHIPNKGGLKKLLVESDEAWKNFLETLRADTDSSQVYNPHSILGTHTLEDSNSFSLTCPPTLRPCTDTVLSFDPETFEEILEVVIPELKPEELQNTRIVQDWLWNKEEQQLYIRYLGFAPMISSYDPQGNLLQHLPWFYIRTNTP